MIRHALAAACALLLAGCAGAAASPDPAHAVAAATGTSAASGGTQQQPAAAASTAHPTSTPSAAPHAGSDAAAAANASRIRIALGASCVVPGGRQSITITVDGVASVSFGTRYADGRRGDTYGGVGIGRTAADGSYRSAWTVSPAAPPGTATVDAGASRDGHLWTAAPATFTVADHC